MLVVEYFSKFEFDNSGAHSSFSHHIQIEYVDKFSCSRFVAPEPGGTARLVIFYRFCTEQTKLYSTRSDTDLPADSVEDQSLHKFIVFANAAADGCGGDFSNSNDFEAIKQLCNCC